MSNSTAIPAYCPSCGRELGAEFLVIGGRWYHPWCDSEPRTVTPIQPRPAVPHISRPICPRCGKPGYELFEAGDGEPGGRALDHIACVAEAEDEIAELRRERDSASATTRRLRWCATHTVNDAGFVHRRWVATTFVYYDTHFAAPSPDTKEASDHEYRKTATVMAHQATSGGMIHSLEGDHTYEAGDYICTGVLGEQWPVKRDIFEATYELVDATE